jgi:hypothetical protein
VVALIDARIYDEAVGVVKFQSGAYMIECTSVLKQGTLCDWCLDMAQGCEKACLEELGMPEDVLK